MLALPKMPKKTVASTLRNNTCLQKFLPVWASTGVLSNAHAWIASLGKSTVWGFEGYQKSLQEQITWFLFRKKNSDLTPNYCQDSVYSCLTNTKKKPPSKFSSMKMEITAYPFLWSKRDAVPGISHLSSRTNLASGSLARTGMNVQFFFMFFSPPVFLFEFMYDWFHSLGFSPLLGPLEWLGMEINCIWIANGSLTWWIQGGGKENLCSQSGLQDKWLYSSKCLWNLHCFILVQDAWEKENSVVKIHWSLMKLWLLQDNWLNHAPVCGKPISSVQK